MVFYTYILKSKKTGKYYKGHTSDLSIRLDQHNKGKTKSTKSGIPWSVVYYERYSSREEAILREKYFKTASGRRYIKSLNLDSSVGGSLPE
ncbi:MAG: GIY-YIG nuclease family protein [Cyclobacteriaceae bacterium]|nr:GIY-YIG nuclease family protein [Cyclobacteriaceae bacterium]